ncbi:hypothetical protein B0H11DRAFT_1989977 [Mycena galericulata]|nr:hypothetical protein B0H11DRAFT_2045124 [Mycena galericulata]KAJ7502273.1 hypothetical protein B0H11DRAFT_1989977 [Mycena galericulata]
MFFRYGVASYRRHVSIGDMLDREVLSKAGLRPWPLHRVRLSLMVLLLLQASMTGSMGFTIGKMRGWCGFGSILGGGEYPSPGKGSGCLARRSSCAAFPTAPRRPALSLLQLQLPTAPSRPLLPPLPWLLSPPRPWYPSCPLSWSATSRLSIAAGRDVEY